MGGKAALIVVFAMSLLFSAYRLKTGSVSSKAAENLSTYYTKTVAHQISISGLNIAAAKLYEDYSWRGPMVDVPFRGGTFSLAFQNLHDTLMVMSATEYYGIQDTVAAFFKGSNPYTKYTFFTGKENGVNWAPGDTVWGPIHTNTTLNHQNDKSIVFYGKATAGKGISAPPKNAKSQFLGGYEVGIYVPEVTHMNDLINAAAWTGYTFAFSPDTMKVELNNDGTIDIYQNGTRILDDVTFSAIAPNGAIYSAGPVVIFGPGKVNTPAGGISIGSGKNIILRTQVSYADDPLTNPSSDDLLALVAMNDIIFDNSSTTDWYVQTVLMAITGSLTATDMNKDGHLDYLGSVYQGERGNAKMFQSFEKDYRHDDRLNYITPPFYPGAANLRLIAWWE